MRLKIAVILLVFLMAPVADCAPERAFQLMETSIAEIHRAMEAGTLTCHDLVPTRFPDRYMSIKDGGRTIGRWIERRRYTSADLVLAPLTALAVR